MLIEALSMAVLLAAPPVVVDPSWRRQPSADEIADHYPAKAVDEWLAGKAVINCRIGVSGKLNNCEVRSEEPQGYGFGAAALGLSGLIEMNPGTVDGQPIANGRVNIPIHFVPPEPDEDDLAALANTIRCYGIVGARLDAGDRRPHLSVAVDAAREGARAQARISPGARATVDAQLAAARARPATDRAAVADCRAGVEAWLKTYEAGLR